jgi:hypothetical protein
MVAAYLGCPLNDASLCTDDQFDAADPTLHLGPDPAPVHAVHGAHDEMIPAAVHGVAIANAWAAAGVEARVDVADADHNLDASNTDVAAIDAFLDRVVAHAELVREKRLMRRSSLTSSGRGAIRPGPGRDGA